MQIDHGCRYPTGLLRQDCIAASVTRSRKTGVIGSRKAGAANGSNLESRCRAIRGFDQRGGCGDECAAEEYLPRLLSDALHLTFSRASVPVRPMKSRHPITAPAWIIFLRSDQLATFV